MAECEFYLLLLDFDFFPFLFVLPIFLDGNGPPSDTKLNLNQHCYNKIESWEVQLKKCFSKVEAPQSKVQLLPTFLTLKPGILMEIWSNLISSKTEKSLWSSMLLVNVVLQLTTIKKWWNYTVSSLQKAFKSLLFQAASFWTKNSRQRKKLKLMWRSISMPISQFLRKLKLMERILIQFMLFWEHTANCTMPTRSKHKLFLGILPNSSWIVKEKSLSSLVLMFLLLNWDQSSKPN